MEDKVNQIETNKLPIDEGKPIKSQPKLDSKAKRDKPIWEGYRPTKSQLKHVSTKEKQP